MGRVLPRVPSPHRTCFLCAQFHLRQTEKPKTRFCMVSAADVTWKPFLLSQILPVEAFHSRLTMEGHQFIALYGVETKLHSTFDAFGQE